MNRLYRSKEERMLGGVAGGLAEYFQVDVVLVRILWVLAFFIGGGGLLAYLIAWIVIPEHKGQQHFGGVEYQEGAGHPGGEADLPEEQDKDAAKDGRRHNAGLILIALGLVFFLRQILPWGMFEYTWPLLLVALGCYFLMKD